MTFFRGYSQIIALLIGMAIAGYAAHVVDADIMHRKVDRLNAAHVKQLSDQAVALNEQCTHDKEITRAASEDYQNRLADVQLELNRVLSSPPRCVPVKSPTRATSGSHAGATGREPARPDDAGIDSAWLYRFAATSEQLRAQVIGLQKFIRMVWDQNKIESTSTK